MNSRRDVKNRAIGEVRAVRHAASGAARTPAFIVLLIAFLAADAFSGDRLGLPLPVGPDRIFFASFLLLLVIERRIQWRTWRVHPAIFVALAALTSAVLSAEYHGTLTTSLGAFALLDRLAVPYLLFALAPVALSTPRNRLILLQFLVVFGVYLGATAVFEILGPRALVYPSFINNPNVGISFGRARGPFLSSDADAAAMATCMFASFAAWAVSCSSRWRAASVVSAALCLAGVFLALTRAEWIGTSLALVVTGLMVPSVRRKLPAGLAGIAVLIGLALVLSPTLRDDASKRTSTLRSVYDRENTDAGGVRAFESHPLFGIGWTEFINQSDKYVRQARDYPLTRTDIEIHNVPLSRFAELGLLGGGLWVVSVVVGPVRAMFARRRRDLIDEAYRVAFVGIAIVWLIAIEFSPFSYPLPNSLVWLFAGLVLVPLGPVSECRRECLQRPSPAPDPPPATPLKITAELVCRPLPRTSPPSQLPANKSPEALTVRRRLMRSRLTHICGDILAACAAWWLALTSAVPPGLLSRTRPGRRDRPC